LLMAWMRCWRAEQQMAALLPAEHIAAQSSSYLFTPPSQAIHRT
jgi:hypothetical protein